MLNKDVCKRCVCSFTGEYSQYISFWEEADEKRWNHDHEVICPYRCGVNGRPYVQTTDVPLLCRCILEHVVMEIANVETRPM